MNSSCALPLVPHCPPSCVCQRKRSEPRRGAAARPAPLASLAPPRPVLSPSTSRPAPGLRPAPGARSPAPGTYSCETGTYYLNNGAKRGDLTVTPPSFSPPPRPCPAGASRKGRGWRATGLSPAPSAACGTLLQFLYLQPQQTVMPPLSLNQQVLFSTCYLRGFTWAATTTRYI